MKKLPAALSPGHGSFGWIASGLTLITMLCAASSGAQQNVPAASAPALTMEQEQFFEKRVRPLLISNCFSCHDNSTQMGSLRLDSRAALLKGGTSGAAIIPGDPEKSLLIRAVCYDSKLKMPPSGKLTAQQIADLTAWVKMGAPWPEVRRPVSAATSAPGSAQSARFWSFQPVKSPPIPVVKNRAWVKSPLDAFILAGLEKKGLIPATPADRRTLLRRATFDLTGLPPTPEEVNAFRADTSPDAFSRVVDRLLASPQYGERWGRHWLDVVRYADSQDARGIGGEGDISEAWRYRDWVVDAFNSDLPYNRFVMDQVAGDLLPPPPGKDINIPGIIATGMLAIGDWGNGDADKEKLITDIVDDQVDVVSRSFMGLTVSCARCHDHKFDPIPTRDYYGLAGIFFSSHILPKLTPKGQGETPLRIPLAGKGELEEREKWKQHVAVLEKQLKTKRDSARAAFAKSLLPETARYVAAAWQYARRPEEQANLSLADAASSQRLHAYALRQWISYLGLGEYRTMRVPQRDVLGAAGVYAWRNAAASDTPVILINTNTDPRMLLTFTLPGSAVTVHPGPQSGVGVGWRSPITGEVQITGRVADADPGGGDGITWVLDHRSALGVMELAAGEFANGGSQDFMHKGPLPTIAVRAGDTLQLLVLAKSSHAFDTTVVEWTITEKGGKQRVWNLGADVTDAAKAGGLDPQATPSGNASAWNFYDLEGSVRYPTGDKTDTPVARWYRAVNTANAASSPQAITQASETFARIFDLVDARSPFWINEMGDETALPQEARQELATIAQELETVKKSPPPPLTFANGVQEGGVPESPHDGIHDAHIHIRGSYARLGELVPRHFPVVLAGEKQAPLPSGTSGRQELARWLTSDTHPLTARVMVNRIWQHHFGQGIVRTPSNFGLLGERPTDPALLDWLAVQFVRNGWSIKKMHRLIMLSATYQQSSDGAPAAQKADPDNRLWGRMNRRRLEAEAIRDNLLAISGELDRTRGGPATRDFAQPRRSLYIMTIRSERTGFGPLFDTPNASASVDARTVSTVAPQALFLLNDPFALARTRAFTRHVLQKAPNDSDGARVQYAYTLAFGRPASEAEIKIARTFLARAQKSAGSGLSPWERYCQILLCTNEFIYID